MIAEEERRSRLAWIAQQLDALERTRELLETESRNVDNGADRAAIDRRIREYREERQALQAPAEPPRPSVAQRLAIVEEAALPLISLFAELRTEVRQDLRRLREDIAAWRQTEAGERGRRQQVLNWWLGGLTAGLILLALVLAWAVHR